MSFSVNSQCQIPYCYTYRLLYAGANIVRPRNGKPSRPCANEACAMTAAFSILNSQFHFRQNKKDAHASFFICLEHLRQKILQSRMLRICEELLRLVLLYDIAAVHEQHARCNLAGKAHLVE